MLISIYRKYMNYFERLCSHGMAMKTWRHERIILCICDQQVSFGQIMFISPTKFFPYAGGLEREGNKITPICPGINCSTPTALNVFSLSFDPSNTIHSWESLNFKVNDNPNLEISRPYALFFYYKCALTYPWTGLKYIGILLCGFH